MLAIHHQFRIKSIVDSDQSKTSKQFAWSGKADESGPSVGGDQDVCEDKLGVTAALGAPDRLGPGILGRIRPLFTQERKARPARKAPGTQSMGRKTLSPSERVGQKAVWPQKRRSFVTRRQRSALRCP